MPPRLAESEVVKMLREQLAFERERNAALLDRIFAMKRDGFTATMQYEAPPQTEPIPPAILVAIARRSDPGTPERREMERRAGDYLRAGLEPDQIAAAVLDGEPVDL